MNPNFDSSFKKYTWDTFRQLFFASAGGVLRGAATCALTHPIDNVRVLVQASDSKQKTASVVREIFAKEGFFGFYKNGFAESLKVMTAKQLWRWPVIMWLPSYLERRNIRPVLSEVATGFALATFDGLGTAPLNKARLRLMSGQGKLDRSLAETLRQGWKGAFPYWSTLSVNWCTALAAQRFYRDKYKAYLKRDLTFSELILVGIAVGVTVSAAAAPFEYVNVHVQGLDKNIRSVLPILSLRNLWHTAQKTGGLYRGFNLLMLARLVQNVTTVTMIDWLSPIFAEKKN